MTQQPSRYYMITFYELSRSYVFLSLSLSFEQFIRERHRDAFSFSLRRHDFERNEQTASTMIDVAYLNSKSHSQQHSVSYSFSDHTRDTPDSVQTPGSRTL